jgi:hypothetical protein
LFILTGSTAWFEHLAQPHSLYCICDARWLFLFLIISSTNIFKLNFDYRRICTCFIITKVFPRDFLRFSIILRFVDETARCIRRSPFISLGIPHLKHNIRPFLFILQHRLYFTIIQYLLLLMGFQITHYCSRFLSLLALLTIKGRLLIGNNVRAWRELRGAFASGHYCHWCYGSHDVLFLWLWNNFHLIFRLQLFEA